MFEPGSEYVGSGHFWDSKFCISILGGGGGGVQKNEFFGGYDNLFDIFWVLQNWTCFSDLLKMSCHFQMQCFIQLNII